MLLQGMLLQGMLRHGMLWVVLLVTVLLSGHATLWAQATEDSQPAVAGSRADQSDDGLSETARKSGYWINVPADLSASNRTGSSLPADRLVARLNQLAEGAVPGQRVSVVLRMATDADSTTTSFEDALKVARAIGQPQLRQLRVIVFIDGKVSGHRLLIALAAEQLLVSDSGSIGNATDPSAMTDETVGLTYETIARRRNLLVPAIVTAMIDQDSELVQITTVGGQQRLVTGEELRQARDEGQVLSEDVLKQPGAPLELSAKQLRETRAVAGIVNSIEQAADVLDLAELVNADSNTSLETPHAVLIQIDGSIAKNRARRWRSTLSGSLESGEVNTWLVELDSSGGHLDSSAALAGEFALVQPPLQTTAGFISGEARGDAALMAMACRPLMMAPDARLGGPGAEAISAQDLQRHADLIDKIAQATKRSPALMRAVLDRDLEVYRYTDRRTGRIRYATPSEIAAEQPDAKAEDAGAKAEDAGAAAFAVEDLALERWERGERIELGEGLSVNEAIQLGLADAEVMSLDEASRRIGLEGIPPTVADRPLVRFVEKIGRSNGLMFLLLMIGFFTLSAEAGAPGLGVPGFISMLCFALYFWMKFLAGTAEWLELVAVVLGLTFIAIEIFIVPGVGIFGVGGMLLTVLGIVLMSQTFVIPQNSYQVEVLTRGIWVALGALVGLVGGFLVIRSMMPHVPILSELVMQSDDAEALDRHERLADYSHLAGQTGIATTILRPAGKARFGDMIVGVVSDGSAIDAGDSVRVREVHGTRIVVEAVES